MTLSSLTPTLCSQGAVLVEQVGAVGVLTLHRPQALNALSLDMIRDITAALNHWQACPHTGAVVLQAASRPGKAPAFCAGGDIRFFHQAALAGDPRLEDFFTEEYALNHLIHGYAKPLVALMDGICMGGGMGISQGAALRVVTAGSKLAMPETHIGLFPDVGGGWFLARCPGALGEYLALTGHVLQGAEALAATLADVELPADELPRVASVLAALAAAPGTPAFAQAALEAVRGLALPRTAAQLDGHRAAIDHHFSQPDVAAIIASLQADGSEWAQKTVEVLSHRSPLMMAVSLEQVRRARQMSLADDLRMERDMVRHCFHLRPGTASETVEGIRALAVDKDHAPRWNPASLADVTPEMVQAFFRSPWPTWAHPLRHLV